MTSPPLNAAIRVALEIHNNTPFVGRNYSRREQFEEIERPTLGKLNPIRYELRKIHCADRHEKTDMYD